MGSEAQTTPADAPTPQPPVDLGALRSAGERGEVPDEPAWIRAQTWKLFLGYLSPEKQTWPGDLARSRSDYLRFLEEFSPNGGHAAGAAASRDKLLIQIYKDMERSWGAKDGFLLQLVHSWDSTAASAQPPTDKREVPTHHRLLAHLDEAHPHLAVPLHDGTGRYVDRQWHAMLRILYLYALLNPSVGYIQGMHEVLRVLLQVFVNGADPALALGVSNEEVGALALGDMPAVEADTFWCFSLLLGEFREIYDFGLADASTMAAMRTLSGPAGAGARLPDNGMVQALERLSAELRSHDPELWTHLAEHSLDPRMPYFSFRWFACILAADFPRPAVVRFWDAILAQTGERQAAPDAASAKIHFLVDLCCALLMHVRADLLGATTAPARPAAPVAKKHVRQRTESPEKPLPGMYPYDGSRSGTPFSSESATESGPEEPDDPFHRGMHLLQAYPLIDARPVVETALQLRDERRARAAAAVSQREPLPQSGAGRRAPLQARLRSLTGEAQAKPRAATYGAELASPVPAEERAASWTAPSRAAVQAAQEQAASRRPLLQRYAEAFQESNAAATMAKARTNLAAAALNWRSAGTTSPTSPRSSATVSSPHATGAPELPIPSVVDSPEDRDAYRLVARARGGVPRPMPERSASDLTPSRTSEDLSAAALSPHTLTLPSTRTAARLGILSPQTESPHAVGGPRPLLLASGGEHSSPVLAPGGEEGGASLTRRRRISPSVASPTSATGSPVGPKSGASTPKDRNSPLPPITSMQQLMGAGDRRTSGEAAKSGPGAQATEPAAEPARASAGQRPAPALRISTQHPHLGRIDSQGGASAPETRSVKPLDALLAEMQMDNWMQKQ